jgi:hypothetical protein
MEAVLQRLDRLTQDEARTTATQTLEVVYGLLQNLNMRVVVDGEQASSSCSLSLLIPLPSRRYNVHRRRQRSPRYDLLAKAN